MSWQTFSSFGIAKAFNPRADRLSLKMKTGTLLFPGDVHRFDCRVEAILNI
jgi:hypothetical protein